MNPATNPPISTNVRRARALTRIAGEVPRQDEWRSAADFMEFVAQVLDEEGIPRPDHYPEED